MCWASQNTLVACSFSSNRGAVVFDGDVMWHFQRTHAYPCVAKDRKSWFRLLQKLRDGFQSVHTHVCVVDVAGPAFEFAATEVSGHQFV